mmetsp:Transcript_41171/g.68468  ORF Transcript_41171/g.68468 Transcript_41171/m.68468 type:complete len:97 (+) Transcript_41171:999-1289(+)
MTLRAAIHVASQCSPLRTFRHSTSSLAARCTERLADAAPPKERGPPAVGRPAVPFTRIAAQTLAVCSLRVYQIRCRAHITHKGVALRRTHFIVAFR